MLVPFRPVNRKVLGVSSKLGFAHSRGGGFAAVVGSGAPPGQLWSALAFRGQKVPVKPFGRVGLAPLSCPPSWRVYQIFRPTLGPAGGAPCLLRDK